MDDDETIKAYIVLYDVDPDDVLAEFAARYPEEYEEYIFAKEGDVTKDIFKEVSTSKDINIDPKEAEYRDPVNGELLQRAIEHKREIYKEFYESWNGEFVKKHIDSDELIFTSAYSPLIITKVSKEKIQQLSKDEIVQFEPSNYGSGYYTITVNKIGAGTTTVEPLGIAIW